MREREEEETPQSAGERMETKEKERVERTCCHSDELFHHSFLTHFVWIQGAFVQTSKVELHDGGVVSDENTCACPASSI